VLLVLGFFTCGFQLFFITIHLPAYLFVRTGSYDAVWLVAILLGILSALINLPIVEKPTARLAGASA
jgi:hypothetical protein